MQHEVTKSHDLLNEYGHVIEPGWARQLLWKYNRENRKAPWFRRKEWDYYLVANEEYAVAFTIADLGFAGLISASFIDFKQNMQHTETVLDPFPMGKKYQLGTDSKNGFAHAKTKRVNMRFQTKDGKRHILCEFHQFYQKKRLLVNIELQQPPMDTICIATPFLEKQTAFYYNQKINCMPASGRLEFDGRTYLLQAENTFGTLDWGRGIWTYDNTWYWGTGSGKINGVPFGINLGYGFSDRSSASENVLFYNGKVHKLDEVTFLIPKDKKGKPMFMEQWRITSNDNRLEGDFVPIIDRAADIDFKIIVSNQHQVFGWFNGNAVLDSGESIAVKNFLCAIEVVHNRY